MQIQYIDACSYDDYDKVVGFLLEHQVIIVNRNKMKMVIAAEVEPQLLKTMLGEVEFDETVCWGEKPLDIEDLVTS